MSRHRDWDIACKVYIGNLGNNASKYEIEDAFGKYGPLRNVWVARNPPGFAFVEFEDPRDAEDSVRGLDGTRVCGVSARATACHPCRLRAGTWCTRGATTHGVSCRGGLGPLACSQSPPPPPLRGIFVIDVFGKKSPKSI